MKKNYLIIVTFEMCFRIFWGFQYKNRINMRYDGIRFRNISFTYAEFTSHTILKVEQTEQKNTPDNLHYYYYPVRA